jgi:hypothetical protein
MRFHKKRLKCEKLTDDGRQLMAKAHMAFRSGELEKKLENNKLLIASFRPDPLENMAALGNTCFWLANF